MAGPLKGVRVLEIAGLGPGPHAAMMFADLGADVVRIERPGASARRGPGDALDHLLRGRRRVAVDLKTSHGRHRAHQLVEHADVLVEGFRPGVAERIGIGPEACLVTNPQLVYARVTGWGQSGPMSDRAGHDINYVGLTGCLHAIGENKPVVPLNLVGDYAGGSMLVVVGVLGALVERASSGRGQVIDVAMVDGACALTQMIWARRATGEWSDEPSSNELDGAAPYYTTYRCRDGKYIAVGALEPQFYALLLEGLGLDPNEMPRRDDRDNWTAIRGRFARTFATHSRDEWADRFADSDACVTPVLRFDEVSRHPHIAARSTLMSVGGVEQPAPAPRFSRTPLERPTAPQDGHEDVQGIVADWSSRP
jgi:alpha-methylacyl-CoA racemase